MRLTIGTNCASRGCCSVFIHTASRLDKLPASIPKYESQDFDSGHEDKFFELIRGAMMNGLLRGT